MMHPTVRLRFVWRNTSRILQQQWIDTEPVETGPIQYEWRDVPVEDDPPHSQEANDK